MKFILSMIICTSVYHACLDPFPMPEKYNSHYECIVAGYEEAIKKAKEMGPKDINQYGTIIKFFCQRIDGEEKIIVPKPKPKVKTSI